MLKREVLWRCVVFVFCACFVGAAASVLPGGVRAEAPAPPDDAEIARACPGGGAVDAAAFRNALSDWVRHVDRLADDIRALPEDKRMGRALSLAEDASEALDESPALQALNTLLEPCLRHLEGLVGEDERMTEASASRPLGGLLAQSGLKLDAGEGSYFVGADPGFAPARIMPALPDDARAYFALLLKQPDVFFEDAGCVHDLEEMGGWAVEWEDLLARSLEPEAARAAGARYRFFMEYLLWSDLDNTPAFNRAGRMGKEWADGLRAVRRAHPDTRTAAVIGDYLSALEAGGMKRSPKARKQAEAAIQRVIRDGAKR